MLYCGKNHKSRKKQLSHLRVAVPWPCLVDWVKKGRLVERQGRILWNRSTHANHAAREASGTQEVGAAGDVRNRSEVEVPISHCLAVTIRYRTLHLVAPGGRTVESDFARMGVAVLAFLSCSICAHMFYSQYQWSKLTEWVRASPIAFV